MSTLCHLSIHLQGLQKKQKSMGYLLHLNVRPKRDNQPQWPFPSDSELPKHCRRFTSETIWIWNDVRCLPQPPPTCITWSHLSSTLCSRFSIWQFHPTTEGPIHQDHKIQNFAQAFWVSTSSTSFWAGTFHAGYFCFPRSSQLKYCSMTISRLPSCSS